MLKQSSPIIRPKSILFVKKKHRFRQISKLNYCQKLKVFYRKHLVNIQSGETAFLTVKRKWLLFGIGKIVRRLKIED
jgi:hypothetical protein